MSADKDSVETEVNHEIEKPSQTEEQPTEPAVKNNTPSEEKKVEGEVENVLLALAEDPAQNLFMDGKLLIF